MASACSGIFSREGKQAASYKKAMPARTETTHDGRLCLVVVCDHCGEPITHAASGVCFYKPRQPTTIYYLHGDCLIHWRREREVRAYEHASLDVVLAWLGCNFLMADEFHQ